MLKIKKVKLIAETSDGKEVVVMDTQYNNAEIKFERDFKEVSFDGVTITSVPTSTYHIIINDYPMKE